MAKEYLAVMAFTWLLSGTIIEELHVYGIIQRSLNNVREQGRSL